MEHCEVICLLIEQKKEQEIIASEDSIEREVTKRIYKEYIYLTLRVFCSKEEEKEAEIKFYKHLMTLNEFIKPIHLKVNEKFISPYTLLYLTERKEFLNLELGKIHCYRTPKDKIVILINFVTIVARSASSSNDTENPNLHFSEVDDFFPLVIYYLIKIHPPMLKSTLRFIQLFRNPDRLISAEGYYHSLMLSAIDFIEKIGPKTIDISEDKFKETYSQCEKLSRASLIEQTGIWQYEPVETKAMTQNELKIKATTKELKKLLKRKNHSCNFDNMTLDQIKEVVEIQTLIIEKIKGLSI